jgi:hypothetical protein
LGWRQQFSIVNLSVYLEELSFVIYSVCSRKLDYTKIKQHKFQSFCGSDNTFFTKKEASIEKARDWNNFSSLFKKN